MYTMATQSHNRVIEFRLLMIMFGSYNVPKSLTPTEAP